MGCLEGVLEIGRGLYVLKELCGHGQFLARLDVLGIEPRLGQRFMLAAFKFSNATSTPLLKGARNQTKLFELLVLDDEQLAELVFNGQFGELTLDDVAIPAARRRYLPGVRTCVECQAAVESGRLAWADVEEEW